MKPSSQSNKSSSSSSKSKKSSKDRDKRKSQGGQADLNNHSASDKNSPSKESNAKLYAGIDGDSLAIYAEQSTADHLSEEITNTLTEDINYRLRYVINDALIKARLSGRNAVNSSDIDDTLENIGIDRVYGAPSRPNWVPLGTQNLFFLDEKEVNLVEIATAEDQHLQFSDVEITSKWLPEKEVSKALRNYFTTMSQMVASSDGEVRQMALRNIGENPRIGPVVEWFYNFSYILLSKDITYDCLTLRALDLIRVMEGSPICRINASESVLKLLVRLILQRLLKSAVNCDVLRPICEVLAILCLRAPLRDFVIVKVLQKMNEIIDKFALSIITIANSIGIEAIARIFLPNIDLFLSKISKEKPDLYTYSILESYYILCKEDLIDLVLYNKFFSHFGDVLIMFNKPHLSVSAPDKKEINFSQIKRKLLATRRQIDPQFATLAIKPSIEETFDMPAEASELGKKVEEHKWDKYDYLNETKITIGKTNLLLPVFRVKALEKRLKCQGHTLLSHNF